MATSPDYPIMGPPRISAAGFATVLARASSPAASSAAAAYSAFTAAGVDPAVGLAVFRKESTYGTAGRAVRNRSWGNIRGGATYPLDNGNFRIYPTWGAGAQDAARLLAIYGRNQIRPGTRTDTVQTFPFVWAPSSDGNAPDAYGDQLAGWIASWARQYAASGSSAPPVMPGTTPTSSPPAQTVAGGLLDEWLARINRRPSDPIRDQDVVPFVQFLVEKRLVPPGGTSNPITSAVINQVRALVGQPWSAVGPAFLKSAEGEDPFGLKAIAAAIGSVPGAIGDVLKRGGQAVLIFAIILLGLYFIAKDVD